MTWVEAALALVCGYLIGSLSTASLLARARGLDLRSLGSGNPGATNVGRVMGVRWGVLVALVDVTKGFAVALLFTLVWEPAGLLAGAAAVLGHVSSPFLRGRGGKGVATALGAVLAVEPLWAVAVIVVFVAVFLVFRWVALSSMSSALALSVLALVSTVDVAQRAWALVLTAVILTRHRTNVVSRWRAWRVYR
ncbi:MAG: acyl phosphate:glycerol-3-phosphate acyltransferase [Actinomycetota bacterium]|nr:acyl phosphate:glycerol-3-phosphate acyltransferase [Actinomycetota bacterium]